MTDSPSDRLRKALDASPFDGAAELARRLGWSEVTVRAHVNGTRGFPAQKAAGYARALNTTPEWLLYGKGSPSIAIPNADSISDDLRAVESSVLPVIGKVQAGVWEVVDLVDQSEYVDETVVVPIDPRFPFKDQWAMQIVGDSVNEYAPSGSYAVCVDISAGLDVRHGQMVVVERIRAQGAEIERTIKQFRIEGGRRELWPRSTNPKHNGPIRLDPENGEECEIRVRGIVLSFVIVAPGID